MARGFGSGGTTSVLGYSNAPLGSGVRRGAEVEAANRSLASGGDGAEAVARVMNAGGGELRMSGDKLPEVLALRGQSAGVTENGAIMMDLRQIMAGNAEIKGNIVAFGLDGKEIKTDRTVTATVVENGISSIKVADSLFRFSPQRAKVEITEDQRQAILTANLPPQMKGLRFNQSGQINGYKINPDLIPDKSVRNMLYKATGSDGVLRFPAGSPVAKALENQLPATRVDAIKLDKVTTLKG